MRILITGGEGQLGRALQGALTKDDVIAPSHRDLDITDYGAICHAIDEARPNLVINAAAWTDTAGCEQDPRRAWDVNGVAPGLVAESSRVRGAAIVHISSNEVFDGDKGAPYAEVDAPNPINQYARSKLEGERRVQAVFDRYYIVRTSWLYGPGRASFPERILEAARDKGSIRAVTDEIASPTRTVDLARAIAKLVRKPAFGVYHLTNSGWCSRLEWAREVLRLAGLLDVPVEPTTQSEFGLPYRKPVFTALANSRAVGLGISLRPWQEALADHFRQQESNTGTAVASRGRSRH